MNRHLIVTATYEPRPTAELGAMRPGVAFMHLGAGLSLNGIPVFVSPLLGGKMPNRRHVYRPRTQRASYHHRIQKKWNKRFGMHDTAECIQTIHGFFVSPAAYQELTRSRRIVQ